MITFPDFWKSLNDNYQWVEWMERIARTEQKNLRKAAETAYGNLLADPDSFQRGTIEEQRKYVGNILKNQKPEAVKPQLQQVEVPKPEEKQEPILTGEAREARIKEWKETVLKATNNFSVPKISKKEAAEEGDWLPKKQAPYNPPETYLILVNEAAKKFAGKKYKGLRYIDGFQRFNFGEVSILAENETDAKDIMHKAKRLATLQLNKL